MVHPGRIPPVVLASASPRRLELLRQIGIDATVMPVDVPEEEIDPDALHSSGIHPDDLPGEVSMQRARMKMEAARNALPDREQASVLVCADTVVYRDGAILDKPTDRDDAAGMIRLLAGGTHTVSTSVVVDAPGRTETVEEIVETRVTFAPLSEEEIEIYLDAAEWRGVAGAYRIQGLAAAFTTHLAGSYSSVMGLPIHSVYSIIKRFSRSAI